MKKCKLGEIANVTKLAGFEHTKYIQGNCTHTKNQDDDVPLFIGRTVRNGKIDENFDWYIPKAISEGLERSKLYKKCLVLPYVGSVGDLAIFEGGYFAHLGSNIAKIELVDNCGYIEEFIYYYLKSPHGQQILLKDIQGAVQKNITMEAIRNVELPLVSLEEQIRLVGILKTIDDKIDKNHKTDNILEAMARTIYDYWFLQFDFPDENGKPYKSSGGKMVWNEELKREIPEGWEVDEIGDYIKSQRGISYNSATIGIDGVPMINLASFNMNGTYKTSGIKMYSGVYEQDKVLKPYDLLMCNTQQTAIDFKKDIIGKAILVPDIFEGDIVSSHHVTAIKTNTDEMKYYLYYLFNTEFFHKYIAGYTNGTNILGLLFDGVEKYKVTIPCKSVLEKYANIAKDIEKQKSKIIKENQELTSLRDFLLPLLMNRQVGFKEC